MPKLAANASKTEALCLCYEAMRKPDQRPKKIAQALCYQRTPVTVSLMSNLSDKRIMTTTRPQDLEYSADGENTSVLSLGTIPRKIVKHGTTNKLR